MITLSSVKTGEKGDPGPDASHGVTEGAGADRSEDTGHCGVGQVQ